MRLTRTLFRVQPRIDDESPARLDVNPATDAKAPQAAVASCTAVRRAPRAAGRRVAAEAAGCASACAARAAVAADGEVGSEVDRHTGEGGGAKVGEAAAVTVAGPTAGSAEAPQGVSTRTTLPKLVTAAVAALGIPTIVPGAAVSTHGHVRGERTGRRVRGLL